MAFEHDRSICENDFPSIHLLPLSSSYPVGSNSSSRIFKHALFSLVAKPNFQVRAIGKGQIRSIINFPYLSTERGKYSIALHIENDKPSKMNRRDIRETSLFRRHFSIPIIVPSRSLFTLTTGNVYFPGIKRKENRTEPLGSPKHPRGL